MIDCCNLSEDLDQNKRMAILGIVIAMQILDYNEDQKWLSQSRHMDNRIRQMMNSSLVMRIITF